jgi:hypothetical protein
VAVMACPSLGAFGEDQSFSSGTRLGPICGLPEGGRLIGFEKLMVYTLIPGRLVREGFSPLLDGDGVATAILSKPHGCAGLAS